MDNDFKHVNDVDRVLRDKNREIELFVEKKVCIKHKQIFINIDLHLYIKCMIPNYIPNLENKKCCKLETLSR